MIPACRRRRLNSLGLGTHSQFLFPSSVFRSVLHPLCAHRCLGWVWELRPMCLNPFSFLLSSPMSFLGVGVCRPCRGRIRFSFNKYIYIYLYIYGRAYNLKGIKGKFSVFIFFLKLCFSFTVAQCLA